MKDSTQNKKVLIISYYWPPSGGAGVQRWLKFTKYLPDFGWDPIVFTPENPNFDLQDASLLEQVNDNVDVLKFPIWEPYGFFKKLSGTKQLKQGQVLEEHKGPLKNLSVFARGNLFIPDPKVFWVKPSVEYLKEVIVKNEIRHVITTGPPHSLHLIGLKLKYQIPSIQWLADFRDPWTEWDLMKKFKMLPFAWRRHQKMEKEVLKVADVTIATGQQAAKDLKRLGARRTAVLTNGFDDDLLPLERDQEQTQTKCLLHLGMLNELRNPAYFFEQLNKKLTDATLLKLQLTGILSTTVQNEISGFKNLSKALSVKDSVAHSQLLDEYKQADYLLLLQSNSKESASQLPGKLFEYLAQHKPIIAFGDPNSDVANILKQTNSGVMLAYDDTVGIDQLTDALIAGHYGSDFSYDHVAQFSRKAVTEKLSDLLSSF